jgi:uncharacterized damage-inducible protein DinB
MPSIDSARAILDYAREKLAVNLGQIVRCTRLLNNEQLWSRTNAHTNSVGNLLLHLAGNVRQWIVGGMGGREIQRNRPAEFAQRGPLPAAQVLPPLEETVRSAIEILAGFDADRLGEPRTIQGYQTSVAVAVMHVVEHFSFHTGQIVHITKALRDVDLSLYDEQGHKLDRGDAKP